MIKLVKGLYLPLKFFLLGGLVIAVFIFSFAFPLLFILAQALLVLLLAGLLADVFLLFNKNVRLNCTRFSGNVFSLGSENTVHIHIENNFQYPLTIKVVDELPFQFQERQFEFQFKLGSDDEKKLTYSLRPTERGEYHFGKTLLFIRSFLGLAERKLQFDQEKLVKVYPSILEMKNMELKAFPQVSHMGGVKKIRRIGHSYEFEKIKNYEQGDDIRSIHWKATGRRGYLMVNQYEDEKAQQVYCLIDKSRVMKMPFNKLSLLDYAINSSLAISNIALRKHDKAGLITFSDKFETRIPAARGHGNLKKILDALYNEQERKTEANYEGLYLGIKNHIRGRSLLFLYTNFESLYALERVLPILRKINKTHLLVVIFFENTEVKDFSRQTVHTLQDIHDQTVAQKFLEEKHQITLQLRKFGIQALYTRPEDLTVNTLNKYLELKSRGLI
ncbi:MAG: DUF58 domain-containing protein [Cytophagaceae bacterium]